MTEVSDWKKIDKENTAIDDLTLSAPQGNYWQKMMGAIARWQGSIGERLEEDGGLVQNESGGIEVDFSQMPQDQINEILSAMKLPIFIDGTDVGTEFYVDGTSGSDTTGDGSQSKPWKTIAFATEFVASSYNINSQAVHINVAAGTYTDPFNLPFFTRTSGSIVIRPAAENDTVNIAITNTRATSIRHTGGKWELQDLHLKVIIGAQTVAVKSTRSFIRSEDQSGELMLTHCDYEFEDQTVTPQSGVYGSVTLNTIFAAGGYIRLQNRESALSCSMAGTMVNATVYWLVSTQGGIIRTEEPYVEGNQYVFNVSGAYSTFLFCNGGSYLDNALVSWNPVDSPTGKRYDLRNNSIARTKAASPPAASEYFPGSIAGTVDASSSLLPALGDTFSSTPIYSATLAEDITFSDAEPYTINLTGAPYSQVLARFEIPAVAASASVFCIATYENAVEAKVRAGSFLNTSDRVNEFRAFQQGGMALPSVNNAAASAEYLSPGTIAKQNVFTGSTGITSISIANAATGTLSLPAGTVITIYGAK